jgi:hypothetical protein
MTSVRPKIGNKTGSSGGRDLVLCTSLFLEDKFDEGAVEVVSDFPVFLLLHDKFVWWK